MKKNYTYKIYKKGEVVSRLSTHSIRRFLSRLRMIKENNATYLRVSYPLLGANEGYYQKKKELLNALNAFNEIKGSDYS